MRLFITSVTTTGSFGGLAGGDARCNTAAHAANKGGTWKAWLSSSAEGAAARQADVGPWYQELSDAGVILTFNNRANLSTTPLTYIGIDEMGRNTSNAYWTGTAGGGTSSGSTCFGWTDNSSSYSGTYGDGSTSTSWTSAGSTGCYNSRALLCIEQSHLPLPSPAPTTRKRLFITSVTTTGSFGGLAGGDARCNTAAQAANKGGTWKAWLSSSAEGAAARQADVGPWYQELSDAGVILTFNNKANLSTTPLTYIGIDEMGRNTSNAYWTGSGGGGTSSGSTCFGWTDSSSSYSGTYGDGSTSTSWTSAGSTGCYNSRALLCIEQ